MAWRATVAATLAWGCCATGCYASHGREDVGAARLFDAGADSGCAPIATEAEVLGFIREWSLAVCEGRSSCVTGPGWSIEDCALNETAHHNLFGRWTAARELAARGAASIDHGAAAHCLAGLRADCGFYPSTYGAGEPPACMEVVHSACGSLGVCRDSTECRHGERCVGSGDGIDFFSPHCGGHCAPAPPMPSRCEDDIDCDCRFLGCVESGLCIDGRCRASRGGTRTADVGEECHEREVLADGGFLAHECRPGLSCASEPGEEGSRCVELPAIGEPCFASCRRGARCDDGVCVAWDSDRPGDPCNPWSGRGCFHHDLTCGDDVCVPGEPALGDPCVMASCGAGLACSVEAQRCVTPQPSGTPCWIGSDCISGSCVLGPGVTPICC